jgi:hypothetical protein
MEVHRHYSIFGLDGLRKSSYALGDTESIRWFGPQVLWYSWARLMQSDWRISRTLFHTGSYGKVLVSSRWQLVPAQWHGNFYQPCSAAYCGRLLLTPVHPVFGTALLQYQCYSRLCQQRTPLSTAGKQECVSVQKASFSDWKVSSTSGVHWKACYSSVSLVSSFSVLTNPEITICNECICRGSS